MKIVVLSRREMEAHAPDEPCVIISIRSPKARKAHLEVGKFIRDILFLEFSDADPKTSTGAHFCPEPEVDPEGYVTLFMSHDDAAKILNFVEKWCVEEKVDLLYIHCLGGISRSRGVAAGLCAVLGLDDIEHYREGIPNAHCKTLIIQEAYHRLQESQNPS